MTMDEELDRLDEPEVLPQEIVQWQPTHGRMVDVSTPSAALGAVAVGALAFGALAIGAIAIGRLGIGRARVRRLEVDRLIVHHVVAPDL